MDLGLAMPQRADTLTPAARAAVESVRLAGTTKRLNAAVSSLVTDHGTPSTRRRYDGPIPAAAKKTLALAERRGFRAQLIEGPEGCTVEGIHDERRVGFRAHWLRGKTAGASWHSGGRDRYKLVDITSRPIGVDARTHTTKAKHRHDAKDRTRLVLVESPRGVRLGITEIETRIKA